MGVIVRAKCNHCSYISDSFLFGGGFKGFNSDCGFPALDKNNNRVTIENIIDREKVMKERPGLLFYDDDSLCQSDLQHEEASIEWGSYRLFNDGYFCPNCHNFSVGFIAEGLFD